MAKYAYPATAFLILLTCAVCARSQTQSDFFNDKVLHDIRITMNPQDWLTLKQNYINNTYYPCVFQWGNVTMEDVAVRSRGKGSRSPVKPGLKIDFNRNDPNGSFLGMSNLVLRNNVQEASMINESVVMKLYGQLGQPAPREIPIRFFVNGEYIGIYHAVENIDKPYLRRIYNEDDGYLYEAQRASGTPFVYQNLGSDPQAYAVYFEAVTHESSPDFATIAALVQAANTSSDSTFLSAMAPYVDLKKLLNYVAVETYVADNDSFLSDPGANNYFLYRYDKTKVSEFIPWDRSNSFLGGLNRSVMTNTNVNVLLRRSLLIPELKSAWLQALSDVATASGATGGWLEQEIDRQFNILRDAALLDPYKQCPSASGVLVSCTNDQFLAAVAAMKSFAQQRQAVVQKELAGLGLVFPPQVTSAGIVSAATFNASPANQVARGQLISLFGSNLTTGGPIAANSLPLPTQLGTTSVQVAGTAIPLILVSAGQINAQLPFELSDTGTATLTVTSAGQTSSQATVNLRATSPGIFSTNSQGSGDGAILHGIENTLVTSANPAKVGEVVVIFCTGLGATQPAVVSGRPAAGERTTNIPTVTIGGRDAHVDFSGLAPGFVGLYQVNVVVPAVASGKAAVVITSAGNASRADVTLPVQ